MLNGIDFQSIVTAQGIILDPDAYASLRYASSSETYEGFSESMDALYDAVPLAEYEFAQLEGKEGICRIDEEDRAWRVVQTAQGPEMRIYHPSSAPALPLCVGVGHHWEEIDAHARRCAHCGKVEHDAAFPHEEDDPYASHIPSEEDFRPPTPEEEAAWEAEMDARAALCEILGGHEWKETMLGEGEGFEVECQRCGKTLMGWW